MYAGDVPAGDGSTDASGAPAASRSVGRRQIDWIRQTQAKHKAAHQARLGVLNTQSEQYLATLEEEIRLLEEIEERVARDEAADGQAQSDAEALRA